MFNPNGQPHTVPRSGESQKESGLEKEVVHIPWEIALPFQVMLFARYFIETKGDNSNMIDNDEQMQLLMFKYGKAFRDYCDSQPKIAKEVVYNSGNIESIGQETIDSIVTYMKSNPLNDNELQAEYDDLEKYKIPQVH
jgi:hypothetical protein